MLLEQSPICRCYPAGDQISSVQHLLRIQTILPLLPEKFRASVPVSVLYSAEKYLVVYHDEFETPKRLCFAKAHAQLTVDHARPFLAPTTSCIVARADYQHAWGGRLACLILRTDIMSRDLGIWPVQVRPRRQYAEVGIDIGWSSSLAQQPLSSLLHPVFFGRRQAWS